MTWLELAGWIAVAALMFMPPLSYLVGLAAGAYLFGWWGGLLGWLVAYVIDTNISD